MSHSHTEVQECLSTHCLPQTFPLDLYRLSFIDHSEAWKRIWNKTDTLFLNYIHVLLYVPITLAYMLIFPKTSYYSLEYIQTRTSNEEFYAELFCFVTQYYREGLPFTILALYALINAENDHFLLICIC